MNYPDAREVAGIIRQVCEAEILPRHRKLADNEIRTKRHDLDLVTIADEEAERILSARLEALFPGSVCVGEEAVAHDEGVLSRLGGDAPVWVIDPVDGTLNFARGGEHFGTLLALVHGGVTQMGWIYQPLQGLEAIAVRGEGVAINDGPHSLRSDADVAGLQGHCSIHWFRHTPWHEGLKARVDQGTGGRLDERCSADSYLSMLTGRSGFCASGGCTPWDHAAGVLCLEEAGGVTRHPDGSSFQPDGYRPEMIATVGPQAAESLAQLIFRRDDA